MTDTKRLSNPLEIINLLPQDVAIIFRHYDHSCRQVIAHKLVDAAHQRGIKVLISGDLHLARKVAADGVHLPSHLLISRQARQLKKKHPQWLITAAVHNHWELRRAVKLGINAALTSPVYITASHPEHPTLGLIGLRRLACATEIPTYALGGLNVSTLPRLKNSGTIGFAGIGEFLRFV